MHGVKTQLMLIGEGGEICFYIGDPKNPDSVPRGARMWTNTLGTPPSTIHNLFIVPSVYPLSTLSYPWGHHAQTSCFDRMLDGSSRMGQTHNAGVSWWEVMELLRKWWEGLGDPPPRGAEGQRGEEREHRACATDLVAKVATTTV